MPTLQFGGTGWVRQSREYMITHAHAPLTSPKRRSPRLQQRMLGTLLGQGTRLSGPGWRLQARQSTCMITPAVMVNMPLHNSEKGTELTFTHPHDQNQANSTVACAFAASREYPHQAFKFAGPRARAHTRTRRRPHTRWLPSLPTLHGYARVQHEPYRPGSTERPHNHLEPGTSLHLLGRLPMLWRTAGQTSCASTRPVQDSPTVGLP